MYITVKPLASFCSLRAEGDLIRRRNAYIGGSQITLRPRVWIRALLQEKLCGRCGWTVTIVFATDRAKIVSSAAVWVVGHIVVFNSINIAGAVTAYHRSFVVPELQFVEA